MTDHLAARIESKMDRLDRGGFRAPPRCTATGAPAYVIPGHPDGHVHRCTREAGHTGPHRCVGGCVNQWELASPREDTP